MNKRNSKPKLLLHTCCAPCLTGVFNQLKTDFDITLFWFNPNIYPYEEYKKRLNELNKYSEVIKTNLIVGDNYGIDFHDWNMLTKNLGDEKEGGKRCRICYKYRLIKTAEFAQKNKFNYFATTLTISPYKNTEIINNIGLKTANKFTDIHFLDKEYNKNSQYKDSIKTCRELNIYRQKYCGCQYSLSN